jgi:DNA-binding CsgD family transcriptional regulator
MTDVRDNSGATLTLTEKQAEVYRLLQAGRDVPDVAGALGVSNGAIYSHIKRIREKYPDVLEQWAHLGTGGRGEVRRESSNGGSGFTPPADDTRLPDAIRSMAEPTKTAVERALEVVNGQVRTVEERLREIDAEITRLNEEHDRAIDALTTEKGELDSQHAQLLAMAGASVPAE